MPASVVTRSLLCLLTCHVYVLRAQSPVPAAPSSAFQLLQDSLATISDTAQLRMRARQSRGDPIRAGVFALRLGELGADPDYSDALSQFRRATKKQVRLAEAWYGMGTAYAARSEWEMRDRLRLGSRVGLSTLERAADQYARSLRADLRFVPAALELARVELSLLDTARLRRAADMLDRVGAAVASPPSELLLAWGQVARAAGRLPVAERAFERYLATGDNRALGLLELGRSRLAVSRQDGEAAYYEGAALDDPVAVAAYRADLQLIAPDSNLREFDRLTGSGRAAFLHRFWTDRDHLELRREGERLQEHYRRLLYARRHFPLTVSRRYHGRYDAFRSSSVELDDRGVIYVRQGEPADRLRPFIFGAMPNESWRYVRADGDLLFHFSGGYDDNGGGDLYDYRLVESVLDLRGAADAPRDQLILSRQSLSPVYSRMLNWGRYGAANEQARERNIGATSIAVGTSTDSHELRFRTRLQVFADLIAVGHRADRRLAHFVFGLSSRGALFRRRGAGVEYPVRVRLVALDRHDRAVATLDTAFAVRFDAPLNHRQHVVGRVEFPLPPGRWSYRAALQQSDSAGVVLPRDSVLVAHDGTHALSLSDIALGSPRRAVSWINEIGDTVRLAPSSLFRERSDVQVYYEVGGTRADQSYRHEITIFRDGDARPQSRPLVAVSFEEAAPGPVVRARRSVQLEGLKKGHYVVEVKITAAGGETQVRRRLLRLIDK
ncbi:MAG TPA: GWxTD domain-containing protein [Gemmatimonadales bacterium]|nr:GWxTD domain-containing protein [Gemmatimonadales bacterium]